ncbi:MULTISPECIES: hypothetical protein [unclassified Actinotalea]|uniref:hypothetical protein n=1 Tax=unclassified Actinotalea TaxID=2638618 RepID=UPI0015F70F3C|nr:MULTISPECIES: hypothetical protein [unclassified Actinotalea]
MSADDPRWVAFVHGADTVGTLTALTSVFSTRGVSFDSLTTGAVHGDAGLIVVTFTASERRTRVLVRTVERLAAVRGVEVWRADDPGLRAAGVVHMPAGAVFRPDAADVRWAGDSAAGNAVLVEGPLAAVERVLAAARDDGAMAVTTTVLPPVAADDAGGASGGA